MSVEIDPAELGFRRPFTVEVAQVLKIKNPNNQPIAFKVKTTAPKQYCVRPNSGRIEPDHEVEVSVLLQAMKQDPPLDVKCRDKFLVQSAAISGDKEFLSVTEIWDSIEKSAIQERKIRVIWQAPQSAGIQAAATPVKNGAATNGVEATPEVPPPAYASPEPDTTSLRTAPSGDIKREKDPESSPTSAAASNVAETVKSHFAEVKREAVAAAESTGLRQRKPEAAPAANVAQVHPAAQQAAATEGVPVQVVAILCLLSFLLAYFFF